MLTTRSALQIILAAIVLLAAFIWLGLYVGAHGEPHALMAFAYAVRGHWTNLAWAFTVCGWPPVVAPLAVVSLAVAVLVPRWRVRALYAVCVMLICWGAADGFQHLFARSRREDWLLRHEHAFSYPSSHATMAIGFYLLWGMMLLRSELPRRIRVPAFAALALLTLGIVWSRLALAAHYPTDVLGGVLLGTAVSLLAAAAVKVLALPGAGP